MKEEEKIILQLTKQIKEYDFDNFSKMRQEGKLFVVDEDLELAAVAMALALGKTKVIDSYIDDGLLYTPTKEEMDIWSKQDYQKFNSLKVAPFTLIQKIQD